MSLKPYMLLGDICCKQGDFSSAETYFLKVYDMSPHFLPVYKGLVDVYKQSDNSKQLIYFLKEWIHYSDSNDITYSVLELIKVTCKHDNALYKTLLKWVQQHELHV